MGKGSIFWLLMILWLFFGVYRAYDTPESRARYGMIGGSLLLFALLFLLGWGVFGFIIQ